ncbi:hypothetical protein DVH24_018845 [Malus domestica]|uniref:Uncharacterized protein n=1 Tax=Malus domestica TaxID=3750 RepID=A0A498HL98_MALDO|nr:hypothetical protein DVH24_018845 [Malus domestica]
MAWLKTAASDQVIKNNIKPPSSMLLGAALQIHGVPKPARDQAVGWSSTIFTDTFLIFRRVLGPPRSCNGSAPGSIWRMTNAVEELKPSTTPHIIRIWNKVQQIRYNTISYLFIFSGILYMSFIKKINSDQTTFLNTFYKYHTCLKVQRLKYKIKYSKSNWSKSIVMRKLSKLKINHENLKHQVQANGWQAWL